MNTIFDVKTSRNRVLASIVWFRLHSMRIGNESYVKQNKSYGLTTLRWPCHVKVEGDEMRFSYTEIGKRWKLKSGPSEWQN